mmetsp:Transcript_58490/g.87090  ORF Transcript_58490/g.87090 Transcript_58490/m.87090 type:complete len:445 (-) Transcript_58490:212-1546(-)
MPPQHADQQLQTGLFTSSILDELEGHNAHFDSLVDMIPARFYVSGNTGDEKYNPKYMKGQHAESKEARRARNKAAKIAKFDPSKSESTLDAKRRKAKEEEELDNEEFDSDDDNDLPPDAHEEEDEEEAPPKSQESPKKETNNGKNNENSNMSRIEILRAKLHAKIAEKRASRPKSENGEAEDAPAISKRAARRAEKQKRVEAAKARKRSAGHSSAENGAAAKKYKMEDLGGSKYNADGKAPATVKDDMDGIDFGGISGLATKKHYEDNKSLSNVNKKKSLERLLEEAEKKQQRLKALKQGDEEDKAKAAKIEWGIALKEASGEKVRNDPAMIKKAMKRKAKKKVKSAEAWKARTDQLRDKIDERQKIRTHNINQRKQGGMAGANLSKKRIVEDEDKKTEDGKKKRRLGPHAEKSRAGFEGKKQDFINGKSGGSKAKGKAGKTAQ